MYIAQECVFCKSTQLVRTPAIIMPFVAHRALGWTPVAIDASWKLRDIPMGFAQALCQTVACEDCGGLFMDLRFGDKEMSNLYRDYRGRDYVALRNYYESGYAKRNSILEKASNAKGIEALLRPYLPTTPCVLDWGGGDGSSTPFVEEASLCHVYDISGKTPRPGVSAVTREMYAAQHYDAVILSHVLEHLPQPGTHLCELAKTISEHTQVYIEVPYENLMQDSELSATKRGAQKKHWHEHINFFSPKALEALCVQAGLQVQALATRDNQSGAPVALFARCTSPATHL